MGKNTHSLKDALLSWAKTQSKHTGTLSNVRHYNALANTLKYLKEVEKGLKRIKNWFILTKRSNKNIANFSNEYLSILDSERERKNLP